jgi:sugar phosphate isomerase/epimerase
MRLGGPIFGTTDGPETWARAVRAAGYTAAYCPLDHTADDATVRAYEQAAQQADIVIAEVGAWGSNPLSPDDAIRRQAITYQQERLALADRIGARCCVNVAGSRGARWDGPHPDNLSPDTFDLIVHTVREIIDAVQPTRTHYCLETMPWVFPDSADTYLCLHKAIQRERFGVHLDPVNLVASPRLYYHTGDLIRECFDKLGPYIVCCHAKDLTLRDDALTLYLQEVRLGLGGMDYCAFLRELAQLDRDLPVLLEHLPAETDYIDAQTHLRHVALEVGVDVPDPRGV